MSKKYKVGMILSIVREYEVEAESEKEAKEVAAKSSVQDLSNCDKYDFEYIDEL